MLLADAWAGHRAKQVDKSIGQLGSVSWRTGTPCCGVPRGEEVLPVAGVVRKGHHAVTGAGQGTGTVQDTLEQRVEAQAPVDAQAGLAEPGEPLPQRLDFPQQFVLPVRPSTSIGSITGQLCHLMEYLIRTDMK